MNYGAGCSHRSGGWGRRRCSSVILADHGCSVAARVRGSYGGAVGKPTNKPLFTTDEKKKHILQTHLRPIILVFTTTPRRNKPSLRTLRLRGGSAAAATASQHISRLSRALSRDIQLSPPALDNSVVLQLHCSS